MKSLIGQTPSTTRDCTRRWAVPVRWRLSKDGKLPCSKTGSPNNWCLKESGKQGQAQTLAAPRSHPAGLQIALVPGQRLAQQMRGVLAGSLALGPVEVVEQCIAVVGVGATLDDALGALFG